MIKNIINNIYSKNFEKLNILIDEFKNLSENEKIDIMNIDENSIENFLLFLQKNITFLFENNLTFYFIKILHIFTEINIWLNNNDYNLTILKYHKNNIVDYIDSSKVMKHYLYILNFNLNKINSNYFNNSEFINKLIDILKINDNIELNIIIIKFIYNLLALQNEKERETLLINLNNEIFYIYLIYQIEELNIDKNYILNILLELLNYNISNINNFIINRIFYFILNFISIESNEELIILSVKLLLNLIKNNFLEFYSKNILCKNIFKLFEKFENLKIKLILLILILKLIEDIQINYIYCKKINFIIFKHIIMLKEKIQNITNVHISNLIYSFNIIRVNYSIYKSKREINIIINNTLMEDFINLPLEIKNENNYEIFIEKYLNLPIKIFNEMKTKFDEKLNSKNQSIKSLSDYNLFEIIGYGAFGNVYLASKKNDKTDLYAIKEIKLDYDSDKDKELKKKLLEKEILSQIDHNNIVKHKESFIKNNKIYIVMEYIFGMNWMEYINTHKERNKSIVSKDIIEIIIQLLIILNHLYKKKIIHRDISTSNLLINFQTKQLKLIDFGLAINKKDNNLSLNSSNNYHNDSEDNKDKFAGNLVFCSPEMLDNKELNLKNDLWSFIVIIYHLISKDYIFPYYSENMFSIVKQITEADYKPLIINEKYIKEIKDFILICEILIKKNFTKNIADRMDLKDIMKDLSYYILKLTESLQKKNYNLIHNKLYNVKEILYSDEIFEIYKLIYKDLDKNKDIIHLLKLNYKSFFDILNNIRLKRKGEYDFINYDKIYNNLFNN